MSSVPTAPASMVRLADYRQRKGIDPAEPIPGLTWKSRIDRISISIVVGGSPNAPGPVVDGDRMALVDYLRDLADTFEEPAGEALFAAVEEGA